LGLGERTGGCDRGPKFVRHVCDQLAAGALGAVQVGDVLDRQDRAHVLDVHRDRRRDDVAVCGGKVKLDGDA